ncbi:MAG TPA: 2Fe-2S iron-sulfur cluster-binding protein, partial [Acidimicrobiia bacterium]
MRALDLKLRIWRQAGPSDQGAMVEYDLPGVSEDMSFLEMLDLLNERLIAKGEEPVAFEHDCREGICGSCGMMINGQAHGPQLGTATCQLHMRHF